MAYVRSLDAQRRENRRAALAALGASEEERRGAFGDAADPTQLDASFEAEGRRFVVAAQLAAHFEPRTTLAKQKGMLRRIAERPHAHAVPVLACGVGHCPQRTSSERVAARPLIIQLGPGESWGNALELVYDYAWANVSYDRAEACDPPAQAPSAP